MVLASSSTCPSSCTSCRGVELLGHDFPWLSRRPPGPVPFLYSSECAPSSTAPRPTARPMSLAPQQRMAGAIETFAVSRETFGHTCPVHRIIGFPAAPARPSLTPRTSLTPKQYPTWSRPTVRQFPGEMSRQPDRRRRVPLRLCSRASLQLHAPRSQARYGSAMCSGQRSNKEIPAEHSPSTTINSAPDMIKGTYGLSVDPRHPWNCPRTSGDDSAAASHAPPDHPRREHVEISRAVPLTRLSRGDGGKAQRRTRLLARPFSRPRR